MTEQPTNLNYSKSKALMLFEYILLALCLCVISLRVTFTEGPTMQSSTLAENVGDNLYSLSVSAVLVFSFAVWLIRGLCSKRFLYRVTGIEVGLGIFCAAAVAAGLAAADKRLAITTVAVLLAPAVMAILLVQIMDSPSKIKLALVTIAALGMVSAYQYADQFFVSNEVTIEQYEREPRTFLEPLGIEPGSFQQFLFEHRLYSKGVHGFFTTSNSAGSFALMAAFAAIALLIDKVKNRKSNQARVIHILACGTVAAVVIFGLALTQSKGAILGALFAGTVLIVLLRLGNWVASHKKAILAVCLALIAGGAWAAASYGLAHGKLPGGSSMLVRWQYWQAAAKMYVDHSLTGVGPGNFARFYTRYKPAEALESVADPHNFPLSILTQYGPIGLVGFLAMIFIPLWKAVSPRTANSLPQIRQPQPSFRPLAVTCLVIISAALLLARPLLMPAPPAETADVMLYVIVTLYVVPVAIFIIGFLLLTTPLQGTRDTRYKIRDTVTTAALVSAIVGVMVHNLIDFAIFEPPVLTALWAVMACLIATYSIQNPQAATVPKPSVFARILLLAGVLALVWCYLNYALIPVAKSTAKVREAQQAASSGQFEDAHSLLDKAAEDDRLSPVPLSLNGRLYLHHFQVTGRKNADLLLQAEKRLQAAIKRVSIDFKNFERLTDVYNNLAQISGPQEKTEWLNKALNSASSAVERYPGCERLHFELAKIAEQLQKTDLAYQEYKEAIEIEDSFRSQFKMMYPNREIISRLGEEKYQFATERIKELKKQQKQD
jgi:hypothetical protein